MTRKIGQLPSIMPQHRNQLIIIIRIALIAKKSCCLKLLRNLKKDLEEIQMQFLGLKLDYVGCFLPQNKAHHVGPNSRRFIWEPNEHPKTTHIYTTSAVTKKRLQKQASLSSQPPKKSIALDKSSSSTTTTTKLTKIIGKYSKTHHFN